MTLFIEIATIGCALVVLGIADWAFRHVDGAAARRSGRHT
jgi:hypothetical protein